MQQLSSQDALFVYLENSKMPLHIGGLYIFGIEEGGKQFDFQDFRDYLEKRLHLSSIFRQRLVEVPLHLGKPFWVDDPDFDLDHHLFHIALPKPGKLRDLADLSAQIYNPPMDRNRPLWKLTFVTGLENIEGLPTKDAFAMIAQVHHSMIDGKSGVEIMTALLHLGSEPPKVRPPKEEWKPERVPTGIELMTRSYGNALGTPLKIFNFVRDSAPKAFDAAKELSNEILKLPTFGANAKKSGEVPKTRFNVPVTGHKIFGAVDVPLSQIKAIKNEIEGATVNDVLLATCGGALRRYLLDKEDLPKESLVAVSPISIRAKNEEGKMGNHISAMWVALGTDTKNPLKRLKRICKKTKASKTVGKAIGADKIMEFVPSEIAALASRLYTKMGMSEKHKPFFNLIITNVPGPPIPLYMNGFRLLNHYGFGAVFDGIGMMIVIFSYAGNVSVCITSCKEIIPDIRTLTNYIREELNALSEALELDINVTHS